VMELGIVGCGAWARKYVEAADDNALGARFSAYTRDRLEADPWMEARGLVRAPSLGELFARVDAVVAAATPEAHAHAIFFGLTRHKPVLVEKPAGCNAGALRELFYRRVDRAHVAPPLVVDHIHLYAPAFLRLQRRFASRATRPKVVRAVDVGKGPFRSFSPLRDYGPHPLAMIFELFGLDTRIEVVGVENTGHGGHTTKATLRVDGVPFELQAGAGADERRRKFEAEWEDGHVELFGSTDYGQARISYVLGDFIRRAKHGISDERDLLREVRIAETLFQIETWQPW